MQGTNLAPMVLPSPDGRYLIAHEFGEGRMPIAAFLVATSGGNARELMRSNGKEFVGFLAWGADGRSLTLRKRIAPDKVEQWRVPLSGGSPELMNAAVPVIPSLFRFHPDGRQVVFGVPTPRKPSEVWTLENFL